MSNEQNNRGSTAPKNRKTGGNIVRRPLVPLVLALTAGLIGAAWGLEIPRPWLGAALVGLLAVLVLLRLGCRSDKPNRRRD